MKINIPKPLLFSLSFLVCTSLYWPALNGLPIWDDQIFWFTDPVMQSDFSYLTIWKNFAWPMSVSFQKLLFTLFHKKYWAYHAFNLCLHFVNSFLVYHLAQKSKINRPFLIFLLFLLHPVNVISVSWMIQVKTLLCFLFAISSLLFFLDSSQNKKYLFLSWPLYLLAVLSKSAALPLPFIYLLLSFKKIKSTDYLWAIPYFLILAFGSYKLLHSSVTREMGAKVKFAHESKPMAAANQSQKKVENEKKITGPAPQPITVPQNPVTKELAPLRETPPKINIPFAMKTFYYYFWQPLLPIENAPVRGLNYSPLGFQEYLHLFFVAMITIITWNTQAFVYLLSALIMLIPFYGLIPAPYMNITWVSDQHLYLVVPALILMWFSIWERWNWKMKIILPVLFIFFFSYQISQVTPFYRNEISFYEESLKCNPTNVPISYNLAYAQLRNKNWNEAYNILSTMYYMGKEDPVIRQNEYFPLVALLYFQMKFPQRSVK